MLLQAISTAASSYLFLKRVHAVYHGNTIIKHSFSLLWLVGVGTSCAVFSDTLRDYTEIADTKHCLRYKSQVQFTVAYAFPVLFDGLVYFAISHKIISNNRSGNKWSWRDLWRGKVTPRFSQAILSGGQLYYG